MIKEKCFLRYPGGKSKVISTIEQYFPKENIEEFREPFVGGGSISLHICKKYPDCRIWINDIYFNLYNFWKILQNNGEELSERLMKIRLDNPDRHFMRNVFNDSKKNIQTNDLLEKAIHFYILNKNSFSGLTECRCSYAPQASEQNFSTIGIEKLKNFSKLIQNFKITNLDYSELLQDKEKKEGLFLFLDPPYDILETNKSKSLYGKNGEIHEIFDHERFFEKFKKCNNDCMITYNYSDKLLERYKNYNIKEWNLKYGMSCSGRNQSDQSKKRLTNKKELMIMNY